MTFDMKSKLSHPARTEDWRLVDVAGKTGRNAKLHDEGWIAEFEGIGRVIVHNQDIDFNVCGMSSVLMPEPLQKAS